MTSRNTGPPQTRPEEALSARGRRAQWFAEIHHPGPRNWVQSVSTSEVRPPKMVTALKAQVVLASIHFDNITQIQRSLEALRTPKWPLRQAQLEAKFGRDIAMIT
jgi:hypothetical protein